MADWGKETHLLHAEIDKDTAHSHQAAHVDQGGHNGHQHPNDKTDMNMSNCDCSCDVCFGIAPIHIPQTVSSFLNNQKIALSDNQNYLPSSTLENPFRPPITA